MKNLTNWTVLTEIPDNESCTICMSSLKSEPQQPVVKLSKCTGHFFHENCITASGSETWVQCCLCMEIYGIRTGTSFFLEQKKVKKKNTQKCFFFFFFSEGTMPKGTMTVNNLKGSHCSGYEQFGTIQIIYSFPDGIQGPEHPSPGKFQFGDIFLRLILRFIKTLFHFLRN